MSEPRRPDDRPGDLEAVFVAAIVREVDFVESLLADAGVEYEVRVEAFTRPFPMGRVCYQGLLFEVRSEHATRCRRLMAEAGLSGGILSEE